MDVQENIFQQLQLLQPPQPAQPAQPPQPPQPPQHAQPPPVPEPHRLVAAVSTIIPAPFIGPVPDIAAMMHKYRLPDDARPHIDPVADRHEVGELSSHGAGTWTPLRTVPEDSFNIVEGWQRTLILNLGLCAQIREDFFTSAGRYLYSITHIVRRTPDGHPMRGMGSGQCQFRRLHRTSHINRGLYERELRSVDRRPNYHASHLCHRGVDNPLIFVCPRTNKQFELPCINPAHHVLEPGHYNSSRIGCPGPLLGCEHIPPCLRHANPPDTVSFYRAYEFDV
ncbi:hypothetical protein PTSG_02071 [Salpingoeca rosetta]|uniref:Uncharacterized protein n=1 Tax=Salpingoeca rosetta (strain ATCC 50818 / BSB-021) TaxID=946362 RepID=F2U2J8_SALR5|nr:uncharacterized protein PTSG_02071 [Salpingoeca rosetta]EGD81353.1 hypothetical protein PTSG_02071 [Salpingoeca rosetta]|eukprot:XP_004996557.1 hypothetical protein PTSG_02071 [Salpingoeca rosetta]